ncbi:MAG TPA: hypothetical protein PKL28_07190 [Rhodocyclaceae bacterium]|nr:hypothetical protein [Rhodocyclaceae bacterium]
MIKALAAFLRANKDAYVTRLDVLVDVYDPTYGQLDPRAECVELIQFEDLCRAIDDFSEEFKP